MQQAARISDFTAFMYMGELIEFNETSRVFTKPKVATYGRVHHRQLRLAFARRRRNLIHSNHTPSAVGF